MVFNSVVIRDKADTGFVPGDLAESRTERALYIVSEKYDEGQNSGTFDGYCLFTGNGSTRSVGVYDTGIDIAAGNYKTSGYTVRFGNFTKPELRNGE